MQSNDIKWQSIIWIRPFDYMDEGRPLESREPGDGQ